MDGVGAKKNIFFVGATNRPEILDEALLRPVQIYLILGTSRSIDLYSSARSAIKIRHSQSKLKKNSYLQRCRLKLRWKHH
ncbi:UNVERIFIED_CONTAM: hypothetical protein GTU68_005472 [Idotea baltica]|nr:hypothetical protein [Idotea baltica]